MIKVAIDTAQDLANLFAAQIKLARLELSLDLQLALKRVAWIALSFAPLVVGYGFVVAALASFLATYCGRLVALGAVAILQIAVAGIALQRTLSALGRTPFLERTGASMTESVHRIVEAGSDGTELARLEAEIASRRGQSAPSRSHSLS